VLRTIVPLVVVGLCAACTACGGSTPTPATNGPSNQPTATASPSGGTAGSTLHFTVSTTGAVTESGTFAAGAFIAGPPPVQSPTCTQFTAAISQFYMSEQDTVGGNPFNLVIAENPYHGPGTYTSTQVLPMQISVDAASATVPFQAPQGPNGPDQFTLTTQSDGSGSFVFTDWAAVSGPARTESGSVDWTCSH
jgi:hypothetical protein